MPRFVNRDGCIADVDDELAKRLGPEWQPVDEKPPAKKAATKPSKK